MEQGIAPAPAGTVTPRAAAIPAQLVPIEVLVEQDNAVLKRPFVPTPLSELPVIAGQVHHGH